MQGMSDDNYWFTRSPSFDSSKCPLFCASGQYHDGERRFDPRIRCGLATSRSQIASESIENSSYGGLVVQV